MNTLVDPFDLDSFPNLPADPDPFIDAAVGRVRAFARWHIAPVVTETVYAECHDGRTLVLPTLRLLSVTQIRAGGATYLPADFTVYRNGSVVFNRWGVRDWWLPLGMVEADITHGFDACPPELLPVIASYATLAASPRDPAVSAMTVGQVTTMFNRTSRAADPDSLENMIQRYRLPSGTA